MAIANAKFKLPKTISEIQSIMANSILIINLPTYFKINLAYIIYSKQGLIK